jgi:hypothetical protein
MAERTICPHCGSPVTEDAVFCSRCGVELSPTEQPNEGDERKRGVESPLERTRKNPLLPPRPMASAAETPLSETQADSSGIMTAADEHAAAGEEDAISTTAAPLGPPGLLDPVRLGGEWATPEPNPVVETTGRLVLSEERLRRMRSFAYEETRPFPVLPLAYPATGAGSYRRPWLLILLALALGIAFLLPASLDNASVQRWSGIAETHAALQNLWNGADVLLLWAYDPATAGELDRAAMPVLRHLRQRGAQLSAVTLLPGGVATAQRVYRNLQTTSADATTSDTNSAAPVRPDATTLDVTFLAGGSNALPLLAAVTCARQATSCLAPAPSASVRRLLASGIACAQTSFPTPFTVENSGQASTQQEVIGQTPSHCLYDLALVIAAQAEDVQQWLELVQPINHLPTIAIVSAAADPFLRPYLDTRQLSGLVSGYDGGIAYQQLNNQLLSDSEGRRQQRFLSGHWWGALAFLFAVLLGNLAVLSHREEHD